MNAQLAEATINVIIAQKCTASRGNYYIVMSNDDILQCQNAQFSERILVFEALARYQSAKCTGEKGD